MDKPLPEDFDPYEDKMRIAENRDPWTIGAVIISIVVQLVGWAWVGGKFDQRMANVESEVTELKAKSTKDSVQDIQIAVITTQLATISTGVTEIKSRLERK